MEETFSLELEIRRYLCWPVKCLSSRARLNFGLKSPT